MKIGIIGAGNVGSTIAHILIMKKFFNYIYLIDINSDMAKGKAIDLGQSKYIFNTDVKIEGGNDYNKISDSDFIVITAGLARKPGMSRDDLLFKNFEIIKDISLKIRNFNKKPFIIVVSNPLDIMAYSVYKITQFPKNKVMGMAGVLDTFRYMYFLEEKFNTINIETMILGSHGDTMVPLSSKTKINSKKLFDLLNTDEIKSLEDRARNGGAEIVSLLKTGSAYYAPASSVVKMIEAIINDTKEILPCSVYADNNYGLNDLFIGLPVKLGKNGIEEIVDINLTDEELNLLKNSANTIKSQINKIKDKI